MDELQRIAKVMARAGICSRRDGEKMILDGRVTLNGALVETPATLVSEKDEICVDGIPLWGKPATRLWAFYKPREVMTTHKDPEGRTTVFELLPERMPRVISVGRLDFLSEGLLLLTNDGEFARLLEHPTSALKRRYEVRVYGDLDMDALKALQNGVTIEGVHYGPIAVKVLEEGRNNHWLEVILLEGKNREIRKVMNHLGLRVNRLIRCAFGNIDIDELELKSGKCLEITDRMDALKGLIKKG